MSECALKTLACRGLRVGPSKEGIATSSGLQIPKQHGPSVYSFPKTRASCCKIVLIHRESPCMGIELI